MPIADRAAQFAPFSALTGYAAVIGETARQTDMRVELDEARLAELDRALEAAIVSGEEVTLVAFREDKSKAGGKYEALSGKIASVDRTFRRLTLESGETVEFEDIIGFA